MAVKNQLKPNVEGMLADAVHAELYASNLYKHLANQLQRLGYFGGQKWFARESADELTHYQIHADYLNDRGTVAPIPAIEAITDTVTDLAGALQIAYDTELALQTDYSTWYAQSVVDPVTQQHLLQFLEIQRKSVGEYGDWLARIDRAAGDPCGVLIIDKELGEEA